MASPEWIEYQTALAFTLGLDCYEDIDWSLVPENAEEEEEEALESFLEEALALEPDLDTVRAAGDFLLSRDGHGAGLWDGPYAKADELHKLAKPYGPSVAEHMLCAQESEDEQE